MELLNDPPTDGISALSFASTLPNLLLASSWDCTARIYDVRQNTTISKIDFDCPCLSSCFHEDIDMAFVGCLDGSIHSIQDGNKLLIGNHQSAVSVLKYNNTTNRLFSGSWDKTVNCIDPRDNSKQIIPTNNKVYSLSTTGNHLVVATAGRVILIFDVRNLSTPVQTRESPLRCQTRQVACSPSQDGFVVGSTEGRVAVEYFDMAPEWQSKKYAFKCHRKEDRAYPVNAIAFHPVHMTFATGGCDGIVNTWDGTNKKKLCQFPPFPTSISSLAFSADGERLAIASSYTHEEGEKADAPKDSIYIKAIDSTEVKPRQKA